MSLELQIDLCHVRFCISTEEESLPAGSSQLRLSYINDTEGPEGNKRLLKAGKIEETEKVLFLSREGRSSWPQHLSGCFSLTLPSVSKNFNEFDLFIGHFLCAWCNVRLNYLWSVSDLLC